MDFAGARSQYADLHRPQRVGTSGFLGTQIRRHRRQVNVGRSIGMDFIATLTIVPTVAPVKSKVTGAIRASHAPIDRRVRAMAPWGARWNTYQQEDTPWTR